MKLLVYDRTCVDKGGRLTPAWSTGSALYRGLGRIDAAFGASSWEEAWSWLAKHEASQPISEIQYWGHGRWGRVLIDEDIFDASALKDGNDERRPALSKSIRAVRERLTPDALLWLRTCEAFGARVGIDFAQQLADGLGIRVAGHTFVIGFFQSGLRALDPGCRPTWSADEGIAEGSADNPVSAHDSGFRKPRTITCLSSRVPRAWVAEDSSAKA